METQNVRAFLKVAELQSFSLAAEALHLTQPAVSKRVAQLEEQLDAALFDRINRQVSLTEAGNALLPEANKLMQQIATAEQAVRDLAGEAAGSLRLATSHHIGLHRLPPILSRFSSEYPKVQIDIEFMDSEQAYERIAQGSAEIAVVTLAPEVEPSVVNIRLWQDPLEFLVGRDHPLAQSTHTLSALAAHPAILPGLNTYTGQIVKALFDQHQLRLNVSMATNYLETIRMLASVGLGWTVLPRSMRDESLVPLQISGVTIERSLGLVHHRGRSLSRAARAFISTLEQFAD